ncbi:MAG TPA: translation initiation factor IF-2 associated domain-containing protein, partial [Variovorax sp.]|nr:translation initiation factor IF-2 associated domain-containing protein [Variovorax sp.]
MSSTTVAEFANELKKTPEILLDQLKSAGVTKAAVTDALTEADKQRLLGFLKASHGTVDPERKKITLTKKSTTEIKQADATGRARTIQVEVRKKRTFIQRDEGHPATPEPVKAVAAAPESVAAEPAAPRIDEAELARREEEARRQAELIRRQEEELVEKRRLREEAEAREREKVERAEQAEQAARAARAKAAAEKAAAAVTEGAPEAPEEAPAVADRKAAAEAAAAQVKEDAKAKAAAESKARADEEAARAKDLDERRRKALAEAEAIRAMMNAPARVLVPHKAPEKPAPEAKAAGVKGTLHKPAAP